MYLKPRPMAEAPLNEPLLIIFGESSNRFAVMTLTRDPGSQKWEPGVRFHEIADLIRAVEIVDAITVPYGYELTGEYRVPEEGEHYLVRHNVAVLLSNGRVASPYLILLKLPPPVRYEYVTDNIARAAKVGDYILSNQGLTEVAYSRGDEQPQLCFRRVEVKP